MTWSSGRSAIFTVPAWLWGGNPLGLFESADLHARRTGDSSEIRVQTNEHYFRRAPDLVSDLASILQEPAPYAAMSDDSVDATWQPDLRSRLESRPEGDGAMHEVFTFYQLHISAAPSASVVAQTLTAVETLQEITVSETGEQAFPLATAYAIKRSDALLHRIKLASVMIRLDHDPDLASGRIDRVVHRSQGQEIFASSSDLHRGLFLLDAYVAPLLGCLTPAVWAVPAYKGYGPILISLGRAISGILGEASEPLQNVGAGQGASEDEYPVVRFDEAAPGSAIGWWASSLNSLFGIMTDPIVFSSDGHYSGAKHLQWLLTLEQLFRRVHSSQLAHRDAHARRVLLFTVLDTLETLTGRPLETHCSLAYATKTLTRLQQALPPAAQQILLPPAERAVRALEQLQSGFFMTDALGGVPIEFRRGEIKSTPLDRATALYVKTLRDATHGHGSNKPAQRWRTESLLAHHNGRVPHDLGLLGYLYLLDLMADPTHLPSVLTAR